MLCRRNYLQLVHMKQNGMFVTTHVCDTVSASLYERYNYRNALKVQCNYGDQQCT